MGTITNIQRFSLNDGPGIRTTVFFKGCNMACGWCHNPETLSSEPVLLRYPQKCIGCGECAADSHTPCFSGARAYAGREASVGETMDEVLQDIDYYQTSGGGVTLSGGEVMLQAPFAAELIQACGRKGISVAIETNLHYPFPLLEGMLQGISLVICDLKLMDNEAHHAHTGANNGRILENIRMLAETEVPYILRTPIIPGVNDTEEEIGAIAAFVAENRRPPLYYELLAYNPLGASKYEAMGMENPYAQTKPLEPQRMRELADVAVRYGISVRIG